MDAKRAAAESQSLAKAKQREKRRLAAAKTFEEFTVSWLKDARLTAHGR